MKKTIIMMALALSVTLTGCVVTPDPYYPYTNHQVKKQIRQQHRYNVHERKRERRMVKQAKRNIKLNKKQMRNLKKLGF